MPGVGIPFFIPPVGTSALFDGSSAISAMEWLLTDLDMYHNAMSNVDIPMERLSEMVSKLSDRKDDLAAMIGKIDDPELKGLLTDALELVIGLVNEYHSEYSA